MKYVLSVLLLATICVAQNSPPQGSESIPQSGPAVAVDQENARKAKALLDQMVEALGGSAYLNIQDTNQQGRTYSFYHGESTSAGTLFWRFYRFPDKERIELTKQRDVAYVYSGNKGFEITYKGTAAQDPKLVTDYVRRREHSLDWVIRRWLKEPGIAFFYDGPSVAGEKPADQVTIMNAKNDSVTIYIENSTHLPIKKSYSWRDLTDKLRNKEDEIFDGYRRVQGVMTPFSVTRFFNGDMSNQRFLHAVTYNTGISDSLFDTSITYDPNKPKIKH